MNDYIKFKKFLAWFVNQLDINNGVIDGNKVVGHGYMHPKHQKRYTEFRSYIDFDLECTIDHKYGNYATKANHIHLSGTDLSIFPEFNRNSKAVEKLFIGNYTQEKTFDRKSESVFVADMGLNDAEPNQTLQDFFDLFKEQIKEHKSNVATIVDEKEQKEGFKKSNTGGEDLRILDSYDLELTRYLYEGYVLENISRTYGGVSDALEKITGIYKNPHTVLPHNLGRISEFCHKQLKLPLLSIGVYNNSGGIGGGFYKIARELKPEYRNMTDKEVENAEKAHVRTARENGDWDRLYDYLNGVSVKDIMQKQSEKSKPVQQKSLSSEQPKKETIVIDAKAVFPDENTKLPEGAIKQVMVDIRERNPQARRKCLERWGTKCSVCEVDFELVYGADFKGKIHVHHLVPVSSYDGEYELDYIEHLRPVCPNCHMIMHCKTDEPYTIEEVQQFIEDARTFKK